VNYEIPPGVALGTASIAVSVNGDPVAFGTARIAAVAPGLFSADDTGQGVAAGIAYTLHADGTTAPRRPLNPSISASPPTRSRWSFSVPESGSRDSGDVQNRNTTLPVSYAGPQNIYVGLDQVNIPLPQSLRGSGSLPVLLTVDGQNANAVTVTFK